MYLHRINPNTWLSVNKEQLKARFQAWIETPQTETFYWTKQLTSKPAKEQ